jgi:hypothetical protein
LRSNHLKADSGLLKAFRGLKRGGALDTKAIQIVFSIKNPPMDFISANLLAEFGLLEWATD